ncbi:fatty-acyl-CoA synthase [Desulfocicer vacuolatum DSM 3385]|uniref:Fatty-acyl-CoA synthase n=1 Tax=Desulfocicer vacuolatum DSM 3385 TaxID=1121400 RepID=A0A1W2D667_9BACT|nr:long-chain fatty acid--CoA ligase [Desulfocicer vacuolatum]SMC92959.1 fatty-acyl-CoA synthase [Desulfocicer vacuolatum DSM 3385]
MSEEPIMKNDTVKLSSQLVLGELPARWARRNPDKEMLVFNGKRFTCGKVNARINALANELLRLGVKQGDKISVLFFNGNEILECYFAAAKIGAISVPLNFRLVGPELAYQIDHSDSVAVIFDRRFAAVINDIQESIPNVRYFISNSENFEFGDHSSKPVDDSEGMDEKTSISTIDYETFISRGSTDEPGIYVDDDEPAFIMYTSGTTGRPKGAVMTHKNIVINCFNLLMEFTLDHEDRYLCVPPLFHTATLALTCSCITAGTPIVLMDNFIPHDIKDVLKSESITVAFFVPAMWIALLQVPGIENSDTASLKLCFTGAAIMPTDVKKRIMNIYPNSGVYDIFGQTEMSPCTTMLKPKYALEKPGSVGLPMVNVEVKIVDQNENDVPDGEVGEIVYKGPTLMKEYYKNPDATADAMHNGWFHSGDLVKKDKDGFIHVVDRAKDMIISGGENIYSAEVEDVIFKHAKVLEVAVIGVPDPDWGESVKAVVVPVKGEALTEKEILEHCQKNLAGYKKPRHIYFTETLPRNAAGKVLKTKLR